MILTRQSTELPSFDGKFTSIKAKWDNDYFANQSIWGILWSEVTIDARLESGSTEHLMGAGLGYMPGQQVRASSFNRTRTTCGFIGGYQRKNRKSIVTIPLEGSDQETADDWSKILLNVFNRESAQETISKSFYNGACIAGMDLIHAYLDFRDDPVNGDLKFESIPLTYICMDPYFKNMDLSDCSFIARRSYVSHATAASLVAPEYYDEIMQLPGNPMGTGRDGRFQYTMESMGQAPNNLLAYDEYYYRDYREQTLLVNKITGDVRDVSFRKNLDIEAYLADNPDVIKLKQNIPTVRLAIMIQDKVYYDGHQPMLIDEYPFIGVYGYFNTMMPYIYSRIQGVCRSLRDAQLLYNRRITLSSDYFESVVNSGWIFKENTVVDVNHLFQTGQGRIIPVKKNANIATDLVPIRPPDLPQSFFQIGEVYGQQFNLVTGINEEMLGSATQDVAGILAAFRQGAGLTTLQVLFDNLDFSCKALGELCMKIIKMNYTPVKIQKILEGKQPTEYFYDRDFGKYHCQVQLSFDTESQKQMAFAQIVQLKTLGYEIPASIALQYATLQDKNKIVEAMTQQEQAQQQAQQMQGQMQQQEAQSRIQLAQSAAQANMSTAAEKQSLIEKNHAQAEEVRSKSVNEDYEALFRYVKALKELETLESSLKASDIANLENIIRMAKTEKE